MARPTTSFVGVRRARAHTSTHPMAYETIIGLETHVQLSTASKAFCADDTGFGAGPNTHIGAVSLALPGALPRVNQRQVEYAVRLGLALGCEINLHSSFDRKNYFYTDLPKGYQITQDNRPVCVGGRVRIRTRQGERDIRIHHIHMEEDAGKSIHDRDPSATLVDLNRAGVPLLEIVSEPDFRHEDEVDAYMSALRRLVRWLGISEGNMERGELRCDVNLSIRPEGSTEYGTRCEIKNMNSMRYARQAIRFERQRQIDLVESGGVVLQSTLNFDPKTGATTPLRRKENAHDYRYFPDPDLPPVVLSQEQLQRIVSEMPKLPEAYDRDFRTAGAPAGAIAQLTETETTARYFGEMLQQGIDARSGANFLVNQILPGYTDPNDFPLTINFQKEFLELISQNKISHTQGVQQLLPELLKEPQSPRQLAERLDLLQNEGDSDELKKIAQGILERYPNKVAAYKKGKKNLIGLFMGELMKASRGKANPKVARTLLVELLSE